MKTMKTMKTIMKSRKADIPVTILVMLTIALCIFALVYFSMSSRKVVEEFSGFGFLGEIYSRFDNAKFLGEKWAPDITNEARGYQVKYPSG